MHTHRARPFSIAKSTAGRIGRAPLAAGYVRLQATSATGNNVKINEVDVGGRLVAPIAN